MVGIKNVFKPGTTNVLGNRTNGGVTWPQVLRYNYRKFGKKHLAMRYKHHGIWYPITWEDYYLQVKYLALGLVSLGFQHDDKLLIIGDYAPQWNYAALAAQANHGLSIGLHPDLTTAEIAASARKTKARFAIAEDQEQVDKFLQIKDKLPSLEKVIFWKHKGLTGYHQPMLASIGQVMEDGQGYEKRHPDTFEEHISSGKAEEICAIIYTSGTTGDPKGVIHTYFSTFHGAEYLLDLGPLRETDNIACYLPPVWMLEYLLSIGCHLLSGSILNFAEEVETQPQDLREIGPDLVYYNARQWESQAGTVQARVQGADVLKRSVYRWFISVGNRVADCRFQGRSPGLFLKMANVLGNVCLFRPIRDSLGLPRARICYTSGAVLSPDAFRFYHSLGVPLKTIYGTTEGGLLSGAPANDIHPDTAGKVLAGIEMGIRADNEIVYRQPAMFSGYYEEPELTRKNLREGWFSSGDAGTITDDGQLIYYDRKDDLVRLACGEMLAPQMVESRLKYSPFIKDAWVVAEPEGSVVAAVIIINYANVGKWAGKNQIAYTTLRDLSQKPAVYDLIERDVTRINADISVGCQISRFVNLHKEFDPDEGELTRDGKLRRNYLKERYAELVGAIFSGADKVDLDAGVRYRDGRAGTVRTELMVKEVKGAGA